VMWELLSVYHYGTHFNWQHLFPKVDNTFSRFILWSNKISISLGSFSSELWVKIFTHSSLFHSKVQDIMTFQDSLHMLYLIFTIKMKVAITWDCLYLKLQVKVYIFFKYNYIQNWTIVLYSETITLWLAETSCRFSCT
jgi:hypothetical protein